MGNSNSSESRKLDEIWKELCSKIIIEEEFWIEFWDTVNNLDEIWGKDIMPIV